MYLHKSNCGRRLRVHIYMYVWAGTLGCSVGLPGVGFVSFQDILEVVVSMV